MPELIKQNVQWFPGHMAKTRRLIKESLNLVDGVVELLDARVPYSSQNPELDSIVKNKPRIVFAVSLSYPSYSLSASSMAYP